MGVCSLNRTLFIPDATREVGERIGQTTIMSIGVNYPDVANRDGAVSAAEIESSPCCWPQSRRPLILQGIFMLLGIGLLVPWNSFISAKTYFESRLCNEDDSSPESSSGLNIESTFVMVYNLASVITLTLIIAIQALRDQLIVSERNHAPDIADATEDTGTAVLENDTLYGSVASSTGSEHGYSSSTNQSHSFWLVLVPLSLYVAVFWSQTFMVFVVQVPFFLQWTIFGLAICGMASGIAGAGIVASAGGFSANLAMNPYLAGQSVGGVAVSFVNFIAAYGEDPNDYREAHCEKFFSTPEIALLDKRLLLLQQQGPPSCIPYRKADWSMFLYFFLGSAVLVACLVGFSYIDRFRATAAVEYETVLGTDAASSPDASPRIGLELHVGHQQRKSDQREARDDDQQRVTVDSLFMSRSEDIISSGRNDHDGVMFLTDPDPANETAAVWRHVRGPAICIFMTFFVTLSLFPGWTSELRSVHQCRSRFRLANDMYVPFGFLLFNAGDLTGRLLLAAMPLERIPSLSMKLVVASCLRCLFFPILFLCNGGSNLDRFHIESDLYSETVQFAFATSNGFLLSAAFVHAPSLIPNKPEMQERMSEILSFAVALGLFCGSLFSYPVSKFVSR